MIKKKKNNNKEKTQEKHQKIKMKELKIMSPRMLPNLSKLSAAVVESKNMFFTKKQTKVIKQG